MVDRIKKRLNAHIEYLLSKEVLTADDYAILVMELDRRKSESEDLSNDTIMRIFSYIN